MKKIFTLLSLSVLLINAVYPQATKRVVLQDMTGAWCGYCVRGASTMEDILTTHPNVIGMALHNGDAMASTYSNTLNTAFTNSFPSGSIDLMYYGGTQPGISDNNWESICDQRLATTANVGVEIASFYNAANRKLSVDVYSNFVGTESGDLRISCVVVEDSVSGTGSGYDQHNYYGHQGTTNCGAASASSPWYNYPCVITGFKHRNVARYNLGGPWGTAGVIPASVSAGQSFMKHYNYTLPSVYNASRIKLVAYVSRYSADTTANEILNANQVAIGQSTVASVNEINKQQISTVSSFPNPFSDVTAIQFKMNKADHILLEVFDLLGNKIKTIADQKLTEGDFTFYWNGKNYEGNKMPSGIYIFRLSSGSEIHTGQMMLMNK